MEEEEVRGTGKKREEELGICRENEGRFGMGRRKQGCKKGEELRIYGGGEVSWGYIKKDEIGTCEE